MANDMSKAVRAVLKAAAKATVDFSRLGYKPNADTYADFFYVIDGAEHRYTGTYAETLRKAQASADRRGADVIYLVRIGFI
jgi:hypothetical protein